MDTTQLGNTDLQVTRLALGGGQIGNQELDEAGAAHLLNAAVDAGVRVIDTGRCYGLSETRIGKHLSHRRDEFVLVTKCCPHWEVGSDWSADIVRRSLETSLTELQTDQVDILLLHGCPVDKLASDEILSALQQCREDGLTRCIGASADGDRAQAAVATGVLDCVETSLSFCDQQVIDTVLPEARKRGLGVLTKRTLAGSCWRDLEGYSAGFDYAAYNRPYTERLAVMGFTPESLGFDGDWPELALRFTLSHPEVSTAIVGGRSLEHLNANVQAAAKGPLPGDVYQALRDAWRQHDDGSWVGRG